MHWRSLRIDEKESVNRLRCCAAAPRHLWKHGGRLTLTGSARRNARGRSVMPGGMLRTEGGWERHNSDEFPAGRSPADRARATGGSL